MTTIDESNAFEAGVHSGKLYKEHNNNKNKLLKDLTLQNIVDKMINHGYQVNYLKEFGKGFNSVEL